MTAGVSAVMSVPSQEGRLRAAMAVVLGIFLFTLPLVEAPKNLAIGVYFAMWSVHVANTRDFGGRWDRFDSAFLAVLASAVLSGLAGYAGDVSGVIRVVGMAWLVKRAPFEKKQVPALAAAAGLGLLIAIPMGAVPFLRGARLFLELPSVGHVNQSALYIAIMAAAAFGWWLQRAQAAKEGWRRWLLASFATLFCSALLVGASRAAILAAAVAMAAIVVGTRRRAAPSPAGPILRNAIITLAVLAATVAALTAMAPDLSHRKLTPEKLLTTFTTQIRMQHWRIGVEAWRERPWLGWGPDSFQRITVKEVCDWRSRRGEACDPARYASTKHAHSLYVATLAERGLLGVAALALLLVAWAHALWRTARDAAGWPLWVASAASFVVVVVGGLLTTTLRVEHGSLALLWLGLWLAERRQLQAAG
jgi:O-antigen ligase